MSRSIIIVLVISVIGFTACDKPAGDLTPYQLSYGDSILYLRPGGNNTVYPLTARAGEYEAFPDGLDIDANTGAIDIADSETGLRYEVVHTDPNGVETSTKIVISGINYPDFYFNVATGDTLAYPVYNADPSRPIPAGSAFDINGEAADDHCAVDRVTGVINLARSIREGLFGSNPNNDDRRDVDIEFRMNDASQRAENVLRVRLYWYTSMSTVAPDIVQLVNDRRSDGVFLRNTVGGAAGRLARGVNPRPPCVIIIAN